jgi:hypothetical protein
MIELSLPVLLQILQTIGILVGIFYYIMTLRNAEKSRKMQMLQRIYESKYNKENMQALFQLWTRTWEDFDDYLEKYGPFNHPELHAMFVAEEAMLDGLGTLVKEGMIDLESVHSLMGRRVLMFWLQFETIIKSLREMKFGPGPDFSQNFEYLANELIKIRKKKGLPIYSEYLHPTSSLNKELNTS